MRSTAGNCLSASAPSRKAPSSRLTTRLSPSKTPTRSSTGSPTGPKRFSFKSGIRSPLPRSLVRSSRSLAKLSFAAAILRFFPSSCTTSDSAASLPRNLQPLAVQRISSIFSVRTRLPPFSFSTSSILLISPRQILRTAPPIASLLPSIPRSPRGAKRMSSTPTRTFLQTAPKELSRASAIPMTSTTRCGTSGAARCAKKFFSAQAPW